MTTDLISALNARHAIPGLAAVIPGGNGLPKIQISSPLATAEIYLHGAHVTSWQPAGGQSDVLFLSRQSLFNPDKAIRGGVPICFPWFGPKSGQKPGDPPAPQHGFARTSEWTLDSIAENSGAVTVTLILISSEATLKAWPHPFRAEYRVTVGAELTLQLEVINTGSDPFTFEEALHTYHRVGDARQIVIRGLAGTKYLDNREGLRQKHQDGDITFTQATDRVYLDTPHSLRLEDPALHRRVMVDKHNSRTTVVWNPWEDGAAALADMAGDEWAHMACIEGSNVKEYAVALEPGVSHAITVKISVATTPAD